MCFCFSYFEGQRDHHLQESSIKNNLFRGIYMYFLKWLIWAQHSKLFLFLKHSLDMSLSINVCRWTSSIFHFSAFYMKYAGDIVLSARDWGGYIFYFMKTIFNGWIQSILCWLKRVGSHSNLVREWNFNLDVLVQSESRFPCHKRMYYSVFILVTMKWISGHFMTLWKGHKIYLKIGFLRG